MSNHHQRKVVEAIRTLDPDSNPTIRSWADALTDEDIIKQMFRNPRLDGEEVRGGRLSQYGSKLLKTLYTFWEIKLDHPLTSRQQLRFARACRLPYYFSDKILLCFEVDVGMWLSMIQGNIDLMDNVLPEY